MKDHDKEHCESKLTLMDLTRALKSMANNKSLGQRHGLLNLIPKPSKDLRLLNSWRPVSLLSTDYKILAKALSLKLQKVIPTLISPDQVGYIKGRNIRENIRTIEDIISYRRLKKYLVL